MQLYQATALIAVLLIVALSAGYATAEHEQERIQTAASETQP